MSTQAPELVLRLTERFDLHSEAYRSHSYNETQVRREFIDPLFKALGWDVDNEKGYAEQWKEVVHEDAIKVGGVTKAPDYSFRLGGRRLFFLEAKKPSVNLKDDPSPAYQLRRYAWTAKMPLSILTDFEEFIVYDTRVKPAPSDKAAAARTLYLKYTDYAERWEEIEGIFSPAAIKRGAFDKYVDSSAKKRGTAEVDDAFLAEIETWREALARNFALRNPGLTQRELNFAVQRTIDRIVFLRICEDRGVEDYGRLQALLNGTNVYPRLRVLFDRADERYNSGLFHFHAEKGRAGAPDELTPRLELDDKVLKAILKRLYYPESPYEFAVMPAEILGQVYERFLGSVIRLTPSHQAKVEQKPEVRKAGGVYYTPAYIVDYIVKHTVGELLKDAKPGPRGSASKLRILDPACGSGSFLLGAYRYLLDWHLEKYLEEPAAWSKGRNPALFQGRRGEWKLTTAERKRILLNNIYGVDIDPQAVEVTKLSLLLKVLEDENAETLNRQLTLFHERALPDLGENVKCGNSLIGPDFYDNRQLDLFDDEERYRINAFDWKREFPAIMQSGGFDAVIGNPPYIRSQSLGERERQYYGERYKAATATYDIYVLFVERSLQMANQSAIMGFILPNKFFTTDYGIGLRSILYARNAAKRIVDFEDAQVFANAGTYTCLLFLASQGVERTEYARLGWAFKEEKRIGLQKALDDKEIDFKGLKLTKDGSRWTLAVGKSGSILLRLQETYSTLISLDPHVFQGLKTSADKIYMLRTDEIEKNICDATNGFGEYHSVERALLKPVVKGEHVQRYSTNLSSGLHILYPYTRDKTGNTTLISPDRMKKDFPHAWDYLNHYKKCLGSRDKGKWATRPDWYAYARSQNIGTFVGPKFLVPYMTTRLRTDYDRKGDLFFVNITTGGYGLRVKADNHDVLYFLSLLNSRLLNHCITQMTSAFRGGYFAVNKQALERLPIRPIDFNNKKDKARHDEMVSLVERMLALHRKLGEAKEEHARTLAEREIAALDARIDRLVYELYGLTEEEIGIVEG